MACQLMPEYGDAWKRRGQARSALGETEGALEVCSAVEWPQILRLHAMHLLGPLSCWALLRRWLLSSRVHISEMLHLGVSASIPWIAVHLLSCWGFLRFV